MKLQRLWALNSGGRMRVGSDFVMVSDFPLYFLGSDNSTPLGFDVPIDYRNG